MAQAAVDYRYTHEMKDDGSMVFTMYINMGGKENKNFQMVYCESRVQRLSLSTKKRRFWLSVV